MLSTANYDGLTTNYDGLTTNYDGLTTNYDKYIFVINKNRNPILDKNQVVKSNQVIEASYQLSAIEQRIVLAAICRIPKSQPITDDELYANRFLGCWLSGKHYHIRATAQLSH